MGRRGPVVGGLGRRVDHQADVLSPAAEYILDGAGLPDVHVEMPIPGQFRLQGGPVRCHRPVRTEKIRPHVVVDPDDIESLRVDEPRRLAADQTGRSRDDGYPNGRTPLEEFMMILVPYGKGQGLRYKVHGLRCTVQGLRERRFH